MIIIYIFICLIILEYIAEELYRKTDKYRSTLGGTERFFDVPEDIEICNIGSGPGLYAISYDGCSKKGFNFSTAPQNFRYGFRLLKKFHSNICKNAIIIIVVMAPLSFGKNNDYDRKDYSDKFYGILSPKDIDGYSFKRWFIVRHPLLFKSLKKIRERTEKISIETKKYSIIQVWKKEFELTDLIDSSQAAKHKDTFKEKLTVLQDGLNYCYEQEWNPVIVIPPIPPDTRKYIGDDFLNRFIYDNIDIVMRDNQKIVLLNYLDERYPDDFFSDDIFMSKKGQQYFSKKLFQDIESKFGK